MPEPKPILVAIAIIRNSKGEILIAKRTADSLLEPLKWEFPGGKVEWQETPEAAAIREVREELGISTTMQGLFGHYSHLYPLNNTIYHVVLLAFLAELQAGEPKNIQTAEFRWVSISELSNFDFVSGNYALIRQLQGQNSRNTHQ